jgi:hypothetical protein
VTEAELGRSMTQCDRHKPSKLGPTIAKLHPYLNVHAVDSPDGYRIGSSRLNNFNGNRTWELDSKRTTVEHFEFSSLKTWVLGPSRLHPAVAQTLHEPTNSQFAVEWTRGDCSPPPVTLQFCSSTAVPLCINSPSAGTYGPRLYVLRTSL